MKNNNTFLIILAFVLIFATLTNLPVESQEDRRQLPLSTYNAIGKLLTCNDINSTSENAIFIRESLGCTSTSGSDDTAISTDISPIHSLNYTTLAQLLSCQDINPTSGNARILMKLLSCQDVNNKGSTRLP